MQKCHTNGKQDMCYFYGKGVINERTVWQQFAKFQTDEVNFEDQEHLSGLFTIDEDQTETQI